MPSDQRMPESVVQVAEQATSQQAMSKASSGSTRQRYFRVPFKPHGSSANPDQRHGWWYAHFDGEYVKRQMELHPTKDPILLIRGSYSYSIHYIEYLLR